MQAPIFIIGSPRSGTTVLGEFFESNSQYDYYLEIDIWDLVNPNSKKLQLFLNLSHSGINY